MGEPIRIADLAKNLITMAGYVPDEEIPIVFTGLRPGEKLYEEVMTEDEEQTQQVRNRIKVAKSPPPPHDLDDRLHELRALADAGDREALLRGIERLVPTYRRTPNRQLQIVPEPVPEFALAEVVPLRVAAGER
jgi:FlaA1/EpsC-like NDP-sugar epimerase